MWRIYIVLQEFGIEKDMNNSNENRLEAVPQVVFIYLKKSVCKGIASSFYGILYDLV